MAVQVQATILLPQEVARVAAVEAEVAKEEQARRVQLPNPLQQPLPPQVISRNMDMREAMPVLGLEVRLPVAEEVQMVQA